VAVETSIGNPYSDNQSDNGFIRVFDEFVDPMELIWHRDKKDRSVHVLEGKGWLLQYDDALPIILEKNKVYFIKAETYHRIIKGTGNLTLKIVEE
jgi:hypothetical protein